MNHTGAKICQSCGMPMRQKSDFGINHDMTANDQYCKFCFQDGSFTDPGFTLEEKIDKNVSIAVKMGMKKEEALELAQSVLPNLKRWNS